MRRHLIRLIPLILLSLSSFAQAPQPVKGSPVDIPMTVGIPNVPQPQGPASVVGTGGGSTYYFWIVAEYTVGNSAPVGPVICANAPATLSVSGYCLVAWNATVDGQASSYDVLMTTTPAQPGGACNCSVITGTTATQVAVQSNSLSSYTVNTFQPFSGTDNLLTTEAVGSNQVDLILRQNGAKVCDLSLCSASGVTGSGTVNQIPKWVTSTSLGNSSLNDNGTRVLENTEPVQLTLSTSSAASQAQPLAITANCTGSCTGTSTPTTIIQNGFSGSGSSNTGSGGLIVDAYNGTGSGSNRNVFAVYAFAQNNGASASSSNLIAPFATYLGSGVTFNSPYGAGVYTGNVSVAGASGLLSAGVYVDGGAQVNSANSEAAHYGVYIADQGCIGAGFPQTFSSCSGGNLSNQGNGNWAALYIANQHQPSNSPTNVNYGLYQAGTEPNVFNGPVTFAGGQNNIPIPASLTTTSGTSDNVTVTGMTSSGHCSLGAANVSAATNIATTYISAKTTNQITVTHTATSGMTYDILCTPN